MASLLLNTCRFKHLLSASTCLRQYHQVTPTKYRTLSKYLRNINYSVCRNFSKSVRLASEYDEVFRESLSHPEEFWGEAAEKITWHKPFERVLDHTNPPFTKWFVGGELNTCYNAVDRNVENGLGEEVALIHDSPVTNTVQHITYNELLEQVSYFAGVLNKFGVVQGDRVLIYMPMIPQAVITMLACSRIGAIHSLVFGGFASKELSTRINHAKPKVIVSASCGIEPGRIVDYKPLLSQAINMSDHKPYKCVIYDRPMKKASYEDGLDVSWEEEMSSSRPHDCVPVPATDPVYLLYTSGTTGTPKAVTRPTGGHAVALFWTMHNIYGIKPGEVWWAASDLGWVVGHSYICYAPLLHGNTSIIYEGKPVGTPDCGAFFRVIKEHGVVSLFTAPTALRAIRREDPNGEMIKNYYSDTFRALFVAGEHCDHETMDWAREALGVPILDHWWQTETGWPITATNVGLGNDLYPPSGCTGRPVPGWDVKVLNNEGHETAPAELGQIVVKLPLPPGFMSTLWENDQKFADLYFTKDRKYYDTMDAGTCDKDGYIAVMSRADDVINVAGHRLSSGALEEAMLEHSDLAECAVIGIKDSLKGHVPLGLCVLKADIDRPHRQIVTEVVQTIRDTIGPVAAFKRAVVVKKLPKTKSGKISRSTLMAMANGQPFKIPPTIEQPDAYEEIRETLESIGMTKLSRPSL
ncbi:acyl-CoA synthetase short-chain family member 3, mitochondrial-like [Saccoglossus kowalevskii]|uniref:Acyl-CoA synthetase short-chain family member 3, mitochondrial n=1 Tax=Saccoglossus kowalevskii TaxID=10224 RepID=A0ABM0GPF2_SACKO|nr:PREDICTED: acyl-CoA synthetase short-chain family member 3, mitochondrial-like [Saccoglossus kowalevskii]